MRSIRCTIIGRTLCRVVKAFLWFGISGSMTMGNAAIWQLFQPLYADIKPEDAVSQKKPFLAHYTSLSVLEKILTTDEIWFSNPLFMNDLDEVRFGITNGALALKGSQEVRAAFETEIRHATFSAALD